MSGRHFGSLLSTTLLVGTLAVATVTAAPQSPIRVGGAIKEPAKLVNVDPVYPDLAKRARVEGTVILEATIDRQGGVRDVRLLRSQPLLEAAAVAAVRQWKYTPTLLNGEPVEVLLTITIKFSLDSSSTAAQVSAAARSEQELTQQLALAPGDLSAMLELVKIYRDAGRISDVEQMLQRALDQVRAEKVADASSMRAPFRIGGDVKEPRRLRIVDPVYPPEAIAAHVSGMVLLEAVIATDGTVKSLRPLKSEPMFEAAAMDAVRQWVYTPTLLNGQPVEVIMTVVVNFSMK